MWTHYFNLRESHGRNYSNFLNTFNYFFTELSFEVYNSLLGQVLRNEESSKFKVQKISAEKVNFTVLRGYCLNFPSVFGLAFA